MGISTAAGLLSSKCRSFYIPLRMLLTESLNLQSLLKIHTKVDIEWGETISKRLKLVTLDIHDRNAGVEVTAVRYLSLGLTRSA
jgi:hypothetical protein